MGNGAYGSIPVALCSTVLQGSPNGKEGIQC